MHEAQRSSIVTPHALMLLAFAKLLRARGAPQRPQHAEARHPPQREGIVVAPLHAPDVAADQRKRQKGGMHVLRDIGQHFSVNRMLSFDSVKLRLDREQSLSFLEFNYMILQAYDFLELSRRSACRLQMLSLIHI